MENAVAINCKTFPFTIPRETIPKSISGHRVLRKAGEGTYSQVFIVAGQDNKQEYALKIRRDHENQPIHGSCNLVEIDILCRHHHPALLHAEKIVPTDNGLGILMPVVHTDLSQLINEEIINKQSFLNTTDKIRLCFEMICGVHFLHRNGYCHFDLKPSNIVLYKRQDGTYAPYVSDFDLACRFDDAYKGASLSREIIAIQYRPPELIKTGRMENAGSDVWSLGMILLWIFGQTVVEPLDQSKAETSKEANEKQYLAYIEKWFREGAQLKKSLNTWIDTIDDKQVKEQVVDLISKMLTINPAKRIKLQDVLRHPIFGGRSIIDGKVKVPSIPKEQQLPCPGSIQRIFTNFLYVFSSDYVSKQIEGGCTKRHFPVAMLFLGVDLVYRTAHMIENVSPGDVLAHNIACCFIAWKYYFIRSGVSKLSLFLYNPKAVAKKVLEYEAKIVENIEGMIYRPYIYDVCTYREQIIHAFQYILPHSDEYYNFVPTDVLTVGKTPIDDMHLGDLLPHRLPLL